MFGICAYPDFGYCGRMMIHYSIPTAMAFCAVFCSSHSPARAGDDIPGPCFTYDIVNAGAFESTGAHDLLIDDGYAYLATDDGLAIIDIDAGVGLPQVGFTDLLSFYGRSLAVHDGYLYANDHGNLSVWNIEDPTDPWFVRFYEPERGAIAMPMTDNNLMGVGRNVVDINFPYAPARNISLIDSDSFLCGLGGNLLLSQHLVVWDLSSPYDPIPLNDPPLGNLYTDQLVIEGDFIYARDGDDFTVLHRTGPATFQPVGSFTINDTDDFGARGSVLTVLSNQSLLFYDVSNPTLPMLISEIAQVGEYCPTPSPTCSTGSPTPPACSRSI